MKGFPSHLASYLFAEILENEGKVRGGDYTFPSFWDSTKMLFDEGKLQLILTGYFCINLLFSCPPLCYLKRKSLKASTQMIYFFIIFFHYGTSHFSHWSFLTQNKDGPAQLTEVTTKHLTIWLLSRIALARVVINYWYFVKFLGTTSSIILSLEFSSFKSVLCLP